MVGPLLVKKKTITPDPFKLNGRSLIYVASLYDEHMSTDINYIVTIDLTKGLAKF
jgi:hypothetical protein